MPTAPLDATALDRIFRQARSLHSFSREPVRDETIVALHDLLKLGPTAFNAQPARFVFVRSPEAKARLAPALSSGNRDKTMTAPLTVIVAYDTRFHEHLPRLSASQTAKSTFDKMPQLIEPTALRNSSLQAAYLIVAARALGLTAGPMSGFNAKAVDAEFFPDGRYRSNILVNLGYLADDAVVAPRAPRFDFDEVATII